MDTSGEIKFSYPTANKISYQLPSCYSDNILYHENDVTHDNFEDDILSNEIFCREYATRH